MTPLGLRAMCPGHLTVLPQEVSHAGVWGLGLGVWFGGLIWGFDLVWGFGLEANIIPRQAMWKVSR